MNSSQASSQTSSGSIPIAMCITDLAVGGAERMFTELALGLVDSEFAPHVFVLAARPQSDHDEFANRLTGANIPVEFLDAKHVWHFPTIARRLRRRFQSLQPTIVQSFLWHANMAGSLAARRAGVPHVLTGIRVAERRARGHLWLARRLASIADYHVCVSRDVAEYSMRVGGLPADRIKVIANGVRLDRDMNESADLSQWGLAADRPLIVAIGRLDRQKQFGQLLRAAPKLFASLAGCQIAIVGEGPERARLEMMRKSLGAQAARVHLLGQRSDAAKILAAADLLVLTSRWEGMPNVVLEAMASGKPIVAASVEGVRELLGVAPNESLEDVEQIYAPNDPSRLVAKAIAILNDKPLAERLGAQNRQRAEQNFSLDKMIAAYRNLYQDLLARST